MDTQQTEVTDMFGAKVSADLVICPECQNDGFHLFVIGTNHNHLQCSACGKSFCQGGCAELFVPEGWTREQTLSAQRCCARHEVSYNWRDWTNYGDYIGLMFFKGTSHALFIGIEKDGYTHT